MTVEDAIEKFFLPPCAIEALPTELRESGERPILHLLRRDLERLYRREEFLAPDTRDDMHGPPFFASLGILAGIDTLARFVTPELNRKGKRIREGDKFQSFLTRIVGMRKYEARIMWALRNALSHSYMLRLEDSLHKRARVILRDGTTEDYWLSRGFFRDGRERRRVFIVNLWELKRLFLEEIIPTAKAALQNPKSRTLRKRFIRRYETHGRIYARNERRHGS